MDKVDLEILTLTAVLQVTSNQAAHLCHSKQSSQKSKTFVIHLKNM